MAFAITIILFMKLERITTFHMYVGSLFYCTINNYLRIEKLQNDFIII